MATQPLHEIGPASAGAEAAALGFAFGLAESWVGSGSLVWTAEEAVFAEEGALYAPGLAEFGLDPARLILVRTAKREEALWAAEQGLAIPGAILICTLAAHAKPLDLKATRRLLLAAEHHTSRCILVKPDEGPTAAWTRWSIAPAPSTGAARELGAPAFHATLTRRRAGAAGVSFILDWNSYEREFAERFQEKCEAVFRQEAR